MPNQTVSSDREYVRARQIKRLQHKTNICEVVYQTSPPLSLTKDDLRRAKFDSTYYNDNFKFLISTTWKAGTTNWREAMRKLCQKTTVSRTKSKQKTCDDRGITFGRLNSTDFNSRIKRYLKVIFVRNPLSRLLSAYRDKIIEIKIGYYHEKAKEIVKLYRKNATKEDIEVGNATFLEFVKYVVENGQDLDPHWYPVFNRLKPCLVPYDFVGKMETMEMDSEYLFQILHVNNVILLDKVYSHGTSGNVELLRKYYETLTSEIFRELVKLYEADFRVFGYRVPNNQTDFVSIEDLSGL